MSAQQELWPEPDDGTPKCQVTGRRMFKSRAGHWCCGWHRAHAEVFPDRTETWVQEFVHGVCYFAAKEERHG